VRYHDLEDFEHRDEMAIMGASFWGEVVVEEPHTAEDE